jgi:hypothetical protein
MFKLVGTEQFQFKANGDTHVAAITIEPHGFNYVYSLFMDGKPIDKVIENQKRVCQTWHFDVDGQKHIVVLGNSAAAALLTADKESTEIYVDGALVESEVSSAGEERVILAGRIWG